MARYCNRRRYERNHRGSEVSPRLKEATPYEGASTKNRLRWRLRFEVAEGYFGHEFVSP